jgi:anaerobic selenocysteine-containing dehydrogenase
MNWKDAERLNIEDGDIVRVITKRGNIRLNARISDIPKEGIIFIPFHFKESPANLLTNPVLDERAKIPEFKVCAARVEKEGIE